MTLVIAHRGASAYAPENTLAALELAVEQQADMAEVDLQRTADGVLVLFHDETPARFGGPETPISSMTWAELQTVRVDSEPIATLEQGLVFCQRTGLALNLELKDPMIAAEVAAAVMAADLVSKVIVSSFYAQALLAMRQAAPQIARGYLMGTRTLNPVVRLREANPISSLEMVAAQAWHPSHELPGILTLIRRVRAAGYEVNVWTVDDPTRIAELASVGATGIITNRPDVARQVL